MTDQAKDGTSNFYLQGGIEVIDIVRAKLTPEQFRGWQLGQAITYACRAQWKHKGNPAEEAKDYRKAANYLNWIVEDIKKEIEAVGCCDATKPGPIIFDGNSILSPILFGEVVPEIKVNSAPPDPHWEAVPGDDGEMWRVRWSEPGADGKYLWVAHYPEPMKESAKRQAKQLNDDRRHPAEFPEWRSKPADDPVIDREAFMRD